MIYVSSDGTSGYALAAHAYLEGLVEHGQSVHWSPRAWNTTAKPNLPSDLSPALRASLNADRASGPVVLHMVPTQLPQLYQEFSGARKYVYTVWETDSYPEAWAHLLNQAHGVLVPCRWNQQVLRDSGVSTPISVIPHLICPDLATTQPTSQQPSQPFTFYCIGPWSNRKGLDLLVEAFCRAFAGNRNVQLLLKTCREDLTRYSQRWGWRHLLNAYNTSARALRRIANRHAHPPRMRVLYGDWSRQQILNLHRRSQCFVSLTRCEGWGLGAFEAATLGNPVIMTGYGGQLDFLDPQFARLLDYRMVPCRVSSWEAFFQGQRWAEPDLDQAAQAMLDVYHNFSAAQSRAETLKNQILRQFSSAQIMPRFLEAISR